MKSKNQDRVTDVRKLDTVIFWIIFLPAAVDAPARADGPVSESMALQALHPFVPIVTIDENLPAKPVVAIRFDKKVADDDLAPLKNFIHLRRLELPHQPMTDAGLVHLKELTELEVLNLNWTRVTPAGVIRLVKDRSRLQDLGLSGVPIYDDDLAKLTGLTGLAALSLRGSLVTDKGLLSLRSFKQLRNLSLMSTQIGDPGLEHLKTLTDLEDLDLDRTVITDRDLATLASLHNLRRLQMAFTAVSDAGLEHLHDLSNLKSLNIKGTRVTQAGVDRLKPGLAKVAEVQSDVVKEPIVGGIAFPPDQRVWFRITGIVNVLNAHTLLYEDGTEVDLNGATQAPELEQQGRIDDTMYPCGREATEFLRRLIGGRRVACIADTDHVAGRRIRVASAFVGETQLNIEMVRNGWAISHHSGMDAWEIIARESKRGLWRRKFVVPEKWLNGDRLAGE